MYLIDTSVVLEIRKIVAGRADPNVTAWANRVDAAETYLSAITVGELEHGVQLLEHRRPVNAVPLRRWLDNDVHSGFKRRILPIDAEVACIAATMHFTDPGSVRDVLVAATAERHHLILVTRNAEELEQRSALLEVLDPWSPKSPRRVGST